MEHSGTWFFAVGSQALGKLVSCDKHPSHFEDPTEKPASLVGVAAVSKTEIPRGWRSY